MPGRSLLKLSRALHGVQSLEELVTRVRTAISETTRYDRVYIHLLNPDGRTFEIVGWVLPNMDLVRERMATIDMSRDALLQRVVRAREPFVLPDLRLDPDADQAQVEFFGNRTAIVIPMFDGDHQLGPLVVATFADQGVMLPTEGEFEFFIHVAALVGVVIGRLRAEESRRQLEQAAAASARLQALGRMAGEVAHDVNNMLLTILVNVELAAQDLEQHPARVLLDDAQQAALRAGQFMRQLLAYSRGQVLEMQPFSVAALLSSVAELSRPLLPASVQLRMEAPEGQEPIVLGDRTQLERVLLNLILNARDALPGGGQISVDARSLRVDSEYVPLQEITPGDYLVLSISDDGVGMTPATQARIFEPFFSTKGAERGTGLGLSVVDGIVRQHHGYVHVYSEVGLGTTFKVYLPLDSAAVAPPAAMPEVDAPLRGDEVLLVVDDDEQVLRSIHRILRSTGCTVHAVGSANAALSILQQGAVHLLVTDVVMAEADGVELARLAQQLQPQLRVLFMTGYARGKLNELRLPHLRKPFAASELLLRVRQAMAQAPSRVA